MSDAESLVELARSLQHLEKAIDASESGDVEAGCKKAFDEVSAAVNVAAENVDDGDCGVEGLEINQTISIE